MRQPLAALTAVLGGFLFAAISLAGFQSLIMRQPFLAKIRYKALELRK
jgi:hypothetical protein